MNVRFCKHCCTKCASLTLPCAVKSVQMVQSTWCICLPSSYVYFRMRRHIYNIPTNQKNLPNVFPYTALYWANVVPHTALYWASVLAIVPTLRLFSWFVGIRLSLAIQHCQLSSHNFAYALRNEILSIFTSLKGYQVDT